jgi:hypothetical protein
MKPERAKEIIKSASPVARRMLLLLKRDGYLVYWDDRQTIWLNRRGLVRMDRRDYLVLTRTGKEVAAQLP